MAFHVILRLEILYMADSDIQDKAGRKMRRRRRSTQAIVKRFAFHANAKKLVYTSKSGTLHK